MSEKSFPSDESWQSELRGSAETVIDQIRGLVRVPEGDKRAMVEKISALWPDNSPIDDALKARRAEANSLREKAALLLKGADELDPPKASEQYIAVRIFCRVNKLEQRGRPAKRELHLNGSIVEI